MTTVDLDPQRHVELLRRQRAGLQARVSQLEGQVMDLEIIIDALTYESDEGDGDADS